jgi:hypothetical protein
MRERPSAQGWFIPLIFGLFLVIGAQFFLILFVGPVWRIVRARAWQEAPCRIVTSEVETVDGSGDDDPTFKVAIRFRYEVLGRHYESDRYDFSPFGSSSGLGDKDEIVRRLPPGLETVCFFNPLNVSEAVIERGFYKGLWLAPLPLGFVAIGVGGIVLFKQSGRRRDQATALAA